MPELYHRGVYLVLRGVYGSKSFLFEIGCRDLSKVEIPVRIIQIIELYKCQIISKQLIVDTDADEIVRNPWRGNPNLGFEMEEYCAYDGTAVASVTLNMSGEIERFSSYELPEEEKIVDSY